MSNYTHPITLVATTKSTTIVTTNSGVICVATQRESSFPPEQDFTRLRIDVAGSAKYRGTDYGTIHTHSFVGNDIGTPKDACKSIYAAMQSNYSGFKAYDFSAKIIPSLTVGAHVQANGEAVEQYYWLESVQGDEKIELRLDQTQMFDLIESLP